MLHRLSTLASQFRADRETALRTVSGPVLVWESAPAQLLPVMRSEGLTHTGRRPQPGSVEPIVFVAHPRQCGASPEVTVGRGPECDIVLAEPTVSRMHARFRQEPHTGVWSVTDLGSHNGTYQNGVLICPGRPAPLFRRASLRLGGVEVLFLQPCAFEEYVRSYFQPSPVRLTRRG
ncbi:FHA domain-containing protein [Pyxidicoccus xibeiensis]|uniref:FHA domain-containing protein n=1 Tax=Pyxidicoccus xibeiensis TaxID=2906759 RepID=UPI0020A73FF9|nr:FHA domain-containing protein [Pyxidicoccus xibeiensis]MCP3139353.1 FHA domain-containing protein [Pyxidicoccus xibeiensis]